MLKRLFDIACSCLALLILSPVLLMIAIMIKWESGGPVFYRGTRVGRFGTPFRVCKFRTMVVNAENIGGPSTADDDPRITRIGKWLRKYKLDEVPELLNVLIGEMSIVGPRPEVGQYVTLLSKEERRILEMRPGLTDWATLWNSDEGAILVGSPDPDRTYMEKIRPEKTRLQMKYAIEHSFGTDLTIIARTLAAVILRRKPQAAGVMGKAA
jgi:lipopolysaccharide/colanic/teichoic acid biosynthesis glycosyltransferase